jgi:hypothetical protein
MMVTYQNALTIDNRTKLHFVETPAHIARATAEASLDILYADVLPRDPIVRLVDPARIVRMSRPDDRLN